jgi:hypothetical protein
VACREETPREGEGCGCPGPWAGRIGGQVLVPVPVCGLGMPVGLDACVRAGAG